MAFSRPPLRPVQLPRRPRAGQGGTRRRLSGVQQRRHGGHRRRVPHREHEGEQRPEDHGDEQVTDVTLKRGVIGAATSTVARPDPQRRPGCLPHGHHPAAERGPHEHVQTWNLCARISSTSAARSTPRAPMSPWRSPGLPRAAHDVGGRARRRPTQASRDPLRDPGAAAAEALPRMDVAGFVGFAAAGPIGVPVLSRTPPRSSTCSGPTPARVGSAAASRSRLPRAGRPRVLPQRRAARWVVRVADHRHRGRGD